MDNKTTAAVSRGTGSKAAASGVRGWLPAIVVALLAAQVTLLWLQGALLNRQRAELASLKSEVRELTAAINEAIFVDDEPYSTPAAHVCRSCGGPLRAARREPAAVARRERWGETAMW
jgi:uncharacterized protein with PIN domain